MNVVSGSTVGPHTTVDQEDDVKATYSTFNVDIKKIILPCSLKIKL